SEEDGESADRPDRPVGRAFPDADGGLLLRTDSRKTLEPVNEDKESQPDHVDEVPVPGHALEGEVVLRLEVAGQAAKPDHRQHDGAAGDVEAVDPGEHEERRAVGTRGELQVELRVGMRVLN